MQDEQNTQGSPAEPNQNPEPQTEAETVAPAPPAEAMAEQPSLAPAQAESPEAASAVPEMAPQPSASSPLAEVTAEEPKPSPALPPVENRSYPAPSQGSSRDLNELRQKANASRTARRRDNLQKILAFASTKSNLSNQDIRDLLRVSQSSASNYLSELVRQGKLKRQGSARAARYSL